MTTLGYKYTPEQRARLSAGVRATFPPVAERFWAKVDKGENCWLWTAFKDQDGYGRFWLPEKPHASAWGYAHRWAWEQENGPLPEGMEIDHLCHTPACGLGNDCPHRACVRPSHMEPVTHLTNMQRGQHATKTHCPRGHPYNEENTYRTGRGRFCRACGRRATRDYLARQREEQG